MIGKIIAAVIIILCVAWFVIDIIMTRNKRKYSFGFRALTSFSFFIIIFTLILSASKINYSTYDVNSSSKQYYINFYCNEGTYFSQNPDNGHEEIQHQPVYNRLYKIQNTTDGISIPQEPTAKNNGFKFSGWYTESDCVNKFNFAKKIDKNTDVYAKWIVVNETIQIDTIENQYQSEKIDITDSTIGSSFLITTEKLNEITEYIPQTESPDTEYQDNQSYEAISVWITLYGSKYHRRSNCGNTQHAYKITLKSAISQGYTPCKKCYK